MPKQTTTSVSTERSRRPVEPMFLAPEYADASWAAMDKYQDVALFGDMPEMALTQHSDSFDSKPYRMSGGTAIIPVHGLLMHRLDWHWPGFLTGYDYITALLERAEGDDGVERIAFDLNSGGGMVAGAFEAAEAIKNCSKPTLGVVDNAAYSAAYLLASACDQIVLPKTGGVGSIGVITMHFDYSKMLDDYGLKVTLMYAGDYKADGNPYEELDESARKRIMQRIEQSYDLFVRTVAENRGMDASKVRDTQAGLFQGSAGVLSGLADAVMSPRRAMAAFNDDEQIGSNDQEDIDMTNKTETSAADTQKSAQAATQTQADASVEDTTDAQNASASTATNTETPQAKSTEAENDGTDARKAERQRVSAITRCEEATGRSKLAEHLAYETDMSAEEAKAVLAAAPKEEANPQASANPFADAMSNSQNPEVGADDDVDDAAEGNAGNALLRDYGLATGAKLQ